MEATLSGKNAIITGASRGLGAAIARVFWDAGASIMLVSRAKDALQSLAASLPLRPHQKSTIHTADVSNLSALDGVVAEARRHFARLDILVNNAGIQGPIGKTWENDWEVWQNTITVDFLAPVQLCRLCVPWMIEYGGGSIVNVSGGGATAPRTNFSAYGSAKAALVRFSETLAEETRTHNIRVNCIAPGPMRSAMTEAVASAGTNAAGEKKYRSALQTLQDGGVEPSRAADLCVFLAGDESTGITGKLISAVWDPWKDLPAHNDDLQSTDVYTLRRIVPKDRGMKWGGS